MIVTDFSGLPDRIQETLERREKAKGFRAAVKTSLKPNATIPILWIVLTDCHLLLCNTHKTRGLSAVYPWSEINCVRKPEKRLSHTIEAIHESPEKEDDILPFPESVSEDEIEFILDLCEVFVRK